MKILSLLVALSLATPAVAFENFYDAPPKKRIIKVHAKKKRAPAVMGYEQRAPERSPRFTWMGSEVCAYPISVVGSQWIDEPGAEESAQKAWMELVRFELGEAYLEINNAKHYAALCSRSSIGEMLDKTQHRCKVTAVPCRPALREGKK
jgi:hypothetical protein